jgi:endonuclease-3
VTSKGVSRSERDGEKGADLSEADWSEILKRIREYIGSSPVPSVSGVAAEHNDPYHVLVSTVISLRTKDEVTKSASDRLFRRAPTAADLATMPEEEIAEIIYPAGFYRTKARNLRSIAETLQQEYGGRVPDTEAGLLTLPGVGRKTANLVLGLGFGLPAICVDTHVHRIPNRLGIVETKTPDKTEEALQESLPREYWIEINGLLVAFGRQVCTPVSPWCSTCPLAERCPRIGVTRSR